MPALHSIGSAPSSEKAIILQRYLALHTQQSSVRRRLDDYSPPISPMSMRASPSPDMSSSEPNSAAQSPVMGATFSQLSPPMYALPPTGTRKRSSRPSVAPIPEDDSLDEFEISPSPSASIDEAERLYSINHDIKTTLTDLLNCDAVRNDGKMRLWIQTRLMDAERELKQQRKARRGSSLSAATTPAVVLTPEENARRSSS